MKIKLICFILIALLVTNVNGADLVVKCELKNHDGLGPRQVATLKINNESDRISIRFKKRNNPTASQYEVRMPSHVVNFVDHNQSSYIFKLDNYSFNSFLKGEFWREGNVISRLEIKFEDGTWESVSCK